MEIQHGLHVTLSTDVYRGYPCPHVVSAMLECFSVLWSKGSALCQGSMGRLRKQGFISSLHCKRMGRQFHSFHIVWKRHSSAFCGLWKEPPGSHIERWVWTMAGGSKVVPNTCPMLFLQCEYQLLIRTMQFHCTRLMLSVWDAQLCALPMEISFIWIIPTWGGEQEVLRGRAIAFLLHSHCYFSLWLSPTSCLKAQWGAQQAPYMLLACVWAGEQSLPEGC